MPTGSPPARLSLSLGHRRRIWSVVFFILLLSGLGIRAYRDLSRPEAWAYWKDLYGSPSLTSSVVPNPRDADRPILFISGKIGPASASWFRDQLSETSMAPGSVVMLTSPGGDLNQAMIMGEIIRSRGLHTAVGAIDSAGRIKPSYCASACVLVYAGGKVRIGIDGSALGVHRFVTSTPGRDPVAETQRTAGIILSYMTRMGVSPAVVEAMSETREVRWLGIKEASAMSLITDTAETAPAAPPR